MQNTFKVFRTICSVCRWDVSCPVPVGEKQQSFECHNCKAYLGEFQNVESLE